MKSSCIEHPANEPLILIRKWQYEFCDGNTTAAALLSFFEYWHNIKLEMQEKNKRLIKVADNHGEEIEIDVSLYQWHTNDDLADALLGIARSKNTINDALDILVAKGVISIHKNPNPKFNFDKTRYFLFYPQSVHNYLTTRSVNNDLSSVNIDDGSGKSDNGAVKIDATITETTTEITTKTSLYKGKPKNQTRKMPPSPPPKEMMGPVMVEILQVTKIPYEMLTNGTWFDFWNTTKALGALKATGERIKEFGQWYGQTPTLKAITDNWGRFEAGELPPHKQYKQNGANNGRKTRDQKPNGKTYRTGADLAEEPYYDPTTNEHVFPDGHREPV